MKKGTIENIVMIIWVVFMVAILLSLPQTWTVVVPVGIILFILTGIVSVKFKGYLDKKYPS